MVELKLCVSDVDYDSLIRALAGTMAGPASMAARLLSDSGKEEMAAHYINANSERISRKLESGLAGKGVRMTISGVRATVQEDLGHG